MKIIAIFVKDGKTLVKELNSNDIIRLIDQNVLHLIVISNRFRIISEHKLNFQCTFHLDWCINSVVENYGKEVFTENVQEQPINEDKGLDEHFENRTDLSNYQNNPFLSDIHNS